MHHHKRLSRLSRLTSTAVAAAAVATALPIALAPGAYADEPIAPELTVSELSGNQLRPGEVRTDSVTLTNNGTAATDGVTFRLRLTRGLAFTEPVDGCTYSTVGDKIKQALCELDVGIAPGESYTVPVTYKVLKTALMEVVEYGTGRTGEAPGEGYDEAHRRLALNTDSSADLVATGDEAAGKPGGKVVVTPSIRNDGPGWIQNNESDDHPALLVNIPKGTTAVEVPEECKPFGIDGPTGPSEPGHPKYVCQEDDYTLEVGEIEAFAIVLKIDKGRRADTSGEVKATSNYDIEPVYDTDKSNNKAALSIDVR
ncbi:hypothetical protein GCM10011583_13490 [Streptomyces camponoticapitis]|uniref:DUF11 domain-containing protein n=1 Tax=Streptomyces camponoticapitis TaxID=1616125 RepID=A0ABQ2E124_9ACTN|nr:hypothetical protein [Streptomyces camponoticapitis]GGJ83120.1 hypothetical protein GCM10011583_13490 [Streptomyces camponoticapitis]